MIVIHNKNGRKRSKIVILITKIESKRKIGKKNRNHQNNDNQPRGIKGRRKVIVTADDNHNVSDRINREPIDI